LVSELDKVDLKTLRINTSQRIKENFNYALRKEKLIAVLK